MKKTKYKVINTGKKPEEVIRERVKEGIVQETGIYKYLGIVINQSGNLKDHILELNRKCKISGAVWCNLGKTPGRKRRN